MKNYYQQLGIEPTASMLALKKAYRKKAMKWHPDRNGGESKAQDMFVMLARAYAVLSDPHQRHHYDSLLTRSYGDLQTPAADVEKDAANASERRKRERKKADVLFWDVMLDYAYELLHAGNSQMSVILKLQQSGCDDEMAIAISKRAQAVVSGRDLMVD